MKTLLWNQQEALAAHELARSRMADRWKSTFILFKKGDWVWLDSRNLKTIYHKKMKPKQEGPFVITKVLGLVTYRLKLPTSWRIHNVFHTMLLKPYRENEIYIKEWWRQWKAKWTSEIAQHLALQWSIKLQVWNPWKVQGGIVMILLLVSLFVSSCLTMFLLYAFLLLFLQMLPYCLYIASCTVLHSLAQSAY